MFFRQLIEYTENYFLYRKMKHVKRLKQIFETSAQQAMGFHLPQQGGAADTQEICSLFPVSV